MMEFLGVVFLIIIMVFIGYLFKNNEK